MGLKILDKKLGRNARNISYLGKDFTSFRQNLIEYAKTYFPNTYSDFNETSPGMMFIEMAAYVGDVLSYYTDSALKESLIQYASDPANVFALANMLGYKAKVTAPAVTTLSVYQLCKADTNGNIDTRYLVTINPGMQVTSTSNGAITFRTTEVLNFKDATNREITVYSVNQLTNKPDYFLVKKKIQAISATEKTATFTFGSPEAYTSVTLPDTDVIDIEKITDSNGNIWYGVPYLGQEMVFIEAQNIPAYDPALAQFSDSVPYILKLIATSQRFTTRTNQDFTTQILFGGGDTSFTNDLITPNIKNVGLGLNNSISTLNQSYDPANFLSTTTYGQTPANTTLTVNYLVGGGITSNVASGDLTTISGISFDDDAATTSGLDGTVYSFAKNSVAVENEIPATGGKGAETLDEVRENALAYFGAQNRAVTAKDYQIRALSLPSKYGSVAKVYAVSDNSLNTNSPAGILNTQTNLDAFTQIVQSIMAANATATTPLTSADIQNYLTNFVSQNTKNAEIVNPFAVMLYVLGYDANGNYVSLNTAVKQNLKTYLDEYRMLTDSVNITDGFVINIGIDFDISVYKNFSQRDVLLNCVAELKSIFSTDNWQINQPIYISDVELALAMVEGVASVQNVVISNLCNGDYSPYSYDIAAATQNKIVYPSIDPAIFEVKFPDKDIKGRVV